MYSCMFQFWERQRGEIKMAYVSFFLKMMWTGMTVTLTNQLKMKNIIYVWKRTDQPKKKNAYPCEVHSNSGGSPWMMWDGLLWWGCFSDPRSVRQESTQRASVLSLLASKASWFGISFWMSALTSEQVSQPWANFPELQRAREREIHKRRYI